MNQCPKFWMEDPAVLVKDLQDFFPFHAEAQRCTTTALNSFTRFGIYLGVMLAILRLSFNYLFLCIAIAIVSAATYYGMKSQGTVREGFGDIKTATANAIPPVVIATPGVAPEPAGLVKGIEAAGKPVADVIGQTARTEPTAANPFMNVLLTEIGDNPTRPPAKTIDTASMKQDLSNEFQQRTYGDPSDVFQHTQNQRIWTVQPATSIPNDRDSYQNWLFRVPGKTCKEGNTRACKTATDGGQLPWLSQA